MYKFLHILLLCSFVISAHASDVCASLLSSSKMQHASVGVHIVDVDTRQVIASYDADRALVPASVTKIVTAASVLKCYSDTTRWYTTMGYDGQFSGSTLQGNIIVKGGIDPSLAHDALSQSRQQLLDSLVGAIQRAGIRRIEGDIIADASSCAMAVNGSWMLEDIGFYYGAGCYGLNYCGNEYDLYLRADTLGSRPAISGTSLPLYPIEYRNHLTVGRSDSALVIAAPYATECMLLGTVPQRSEPFKLRCAITDPPRLMAMHLYDALQAAGIEVVGEATTDRMCVESGEPMPVLNTTLYKHASSRLSEMLRYMMHKSSNLYAEAMLQYVALSQNAVAQTEQALQIERDMWQNEGLDISAMELYDGSGMSKKNTMTPRFIASLLVDAYHDKQLGKDFVNLFPQAGKEGSVRSFFAKNPLPGVLRVKSGSMRGVFCYAGYYTHAGKTYALVLMSNNHTCKASDVRRSYEKLLRGIWQTKK